ncbi:MAG TPA: HemK2/MTQ2 family protein methyltransferase [Thermoplasmata archaeon]|nr:HemK2/MTQ2 family protein methyltransferase [Thermoplasmata archaeon]
MPTVPHTGTPPRPAGPAGRPETPYYPARADTLLLLPFARVPTGSTFLEVGAGNGEVALAAARSGARVVATDLNPHALRALAARARTERLPLALVRTDLARGLGRFDRAVFNPPYLPTRPEERDPDPWHNLALDGGADGTAVTARWVSDLPNHLVPGGEGFLLTSTQQSQASLKRLWSSWWAGGGRAEVVASQPLEGERLEVWRLIGARTESGPA